jgi:2-phospho-L-lactate guanylyltransferase (CobY/MobA/RfbA family)
MRFVAFEGIEAWCLLVSWKKIIKFVFIPYLMKYAAFVPFKGENWHTRLEEILTYEQRRELALRELFHVLRVWSKHADLYVGLQSSGEINSLQLRLRLAILTLAYDIGFLSKLLRMRTLYIDNVNEGISQFSNLASMNGYKGIIISGSDLPLLSYEDVRYLLNLNEEVVFSSAEDGGTPVYRIKPPGIYVPQLYVDDGFTNTRRQEKILDEMKIPYRKINDMDGLCRDLDTPENLKYISRHGNSLPVAYLRSLPTCQNFFEC